MVARRSSRKGEPGNPGRESARDRHADRAQSRKPDAQIRAVIHGNLLNRERKAHRQRPG
jgi:hypothetical protein